MIQNIKDFLKQSWNLISNLSNPYSIINQKGPSDGQFGYLPAIKADQQPLLQLPSMVTLENIELTLRSYELQSLKNIQKSFDTIPNIEWERCFYKIAQIKNYLLKSFFKHAQKDIVHDNIPSLEKAITILKERGINPNSVSIYDWMPENAHDSVVGAANICQSEEGNFEAYIKLSSQRLQESSFEYYADLTIHHEITHLLECHSITSRYIRTLIAKYYPALDLDNHAAFINYKKSTEFIAELLPCLLNADLAKAYMQETQQALQENPNEHESTMHPSFKELYPWLECIVVCHDAARCENTLFIASANVQTI